MHMDLCSKNSRHLSVVLHLVFERCQSLSDLLAFFGPLGILLVRDRTMDIIDSASLRSILAMTCYGHQIPGLQEL